MVTTSTVTTYTCDETTCNGTTTDLASAPGWITINGHSSIDVIADDGTTKTANIDVRKDFHTITCLETYIAALKEGEG